MAQQTETARTVDVALYVVAQTGEGWKVRAPTGGVAYLSSDDAFRLSPERVQPARFRLPRWLWARVSEGS